MTVVNILLFLDFTALDAFGPVEVLGSVEDYRLRYLSREGGLVGNGQGIRILTEPAGEAEAGGILLVPGGWGTRPLADDADFLRMLAGLADRAEWCLSVCTGAALLAKCGALDGRRATTNKRAFDWAASCGPNVHWAREARWVVDGKFYTAAGVAAGMDMALGFVADRFGRERAEAIGRRMEYLRHKDADHSLF